MNAARIQTAINSAHLHVRHQPRLPNTARTIRKRDYSRRATRGSMILSRYAYRAGRGNPAYSGATLSAIPRRFLLSVVLWRLAVGSVRAGRSLSPVFHPAVSPPPFAVESEAADSNITQESHIMSQANTGEIRPFSDRIDAALILAESATAILDKNPKPEAIEDAAHALIRAGVGLLSIANEVFLIDGREQAELHAALVNAKEALNLALAGDLGDGPGAVVILVRDLLETWAERIDCVNLDCISVEDSSHE